MLREQRLGAVWHLLWRPHLSREGVRPGEAVETIPRPAEALEIIPGPEEASETIPLPPSRAPRLWGPLARRGSGGRWGGRAPRERRRGPRCVPPAVGGGLACHGSGKRWALYALRERRRARRTLRSPSRGVLAHHGSGGRWAVRAPRERRRARRMAIGSNEDASALAFALGAALARPPWLPSNAGAGLVRGPPQTRPCQRAR